MRYKYQTVEVDPASEEKMDKTLTEHAAAGWRLHSVVPTYICRWPLNSNQEGPESIHVGCARMIFEREVSIERFISEMG